MKPAYRLPESTPPTQSMDVILNDIVGFSSYCESMGISTSNTRISRYTSYLKEITSARPKLDTKFFINESKSPIQHELDRFLYVLREIHELGWIYRGLSKSNYKGIRDKVRTVVRGSDFAILDKNSISRDTQFELRIASYLGRADYEFDFSTTTDIIAAKGYRQYFIECKRVSSSKQLNRRIKEAFEQLERMNLDKALRKRRYGLVCVDVTKVAFSHNGLTFGVTVEHARDIIREKIKAIALSIEAGGVVFPNVNVLGIWLQIHIPSLVQHPPLPTTRFSSLYLSNPDLSCRARLAERKFLSQTLLAPKAEHDDIPPEPAILRTSVQVPSGTKFIFDKEIVQHLHENKELPDIPDDHVIFSIGPAAASDDEFEDYFIYDLRVAINQMDETELAEKLSSFNGTLQILLGPTILYRHRYVTKPMWFDKSFRP